MNTFGFYYLIGAGGTGSILAPHLLRHLKKIHGNEFQLYIVDGDKISDKNIGRQDFNVDQIGGAKAVELTLKIDPLGTNVEPLMAYVDDKWCAEFMRNNDTIIIAVDNYRARADIERRALELDNVTVINGGNESETATLQVFMRRQGENVTPPLSYMHPEILTPGLTREEESCLVRAENPDDPQTIAANLMSAALILGALHHLAKVNLTGGDPLYHEVYADLNKGKAGGPDWRDMGTDAWKTYEPEAVTA